MLLGGLPCFLEFADFAFDTLLRSEVMRWAEIASKSNSSAKMGSFRVLGPFLNREKNLECGWYILQVHCTCRSSRSTYLLQCGSHAGFPGYFFPFSRPFFDSLFLFIHYCLCVRYQYPSSSAVPPDNRVLTPGALVICLSGGFPGAGHK